MRFYTKTDEWVKVEGNKATIGISKKAAEELGDIVYLDMPSVGDTFGKDESFGAVESVKAAADLNMPIGGKIVRVNEKLEDAPELLNEDPLNEFIIEIEDFDEEELKSLLKPEEYEEV